MDEKGVDQKWVAQNWMGQNQNWMGQIAGPNGGSNIGSSVQLLDLERLQNPLLAAARLDTQG